jgi:hypothetical protein
MGNGNPNRLPGIAYNGRGERLMAPTSMMERNNSVGSQKSVGIISRIDYRDQSPAHLGNGGGSSSLILDDGPDKTYDQTFI